MFRTARPVLKRAKNVLFVGTRAIAPIVETAAKKWIM